MSGRRDMQHGNQIGASENLKAANTYHKAKPEPVFQEWCSDLVSTICSLFTFSSQKTLLNRTKPPPICLFFAMLCYCERLGVVPEIPLSALWLLLYLFFFSTKSVGWYVCICQCSLSTFQSRGSRVHTKFFQTVPTQS